MTTIAIANPIPPGWRERLGARRSLVAPAVAQLPVLGGEAVGLLALLAAQRRRPVAAVILSVPCPLVSPVAGAFLMLALMAWALATPRGRRLPLVALVCLTAAPLLVLRAS